jgi:hypothetical protein
VTIWTPANLGQLTSGDPEGARSCVAYSDAYMVSFATHGAVAPTGRRIREWTGDTSGGLELRQGEVAIEAHTTVEVVTGVFTRAQLYGRLEDGWAGVLIGDYSAISGTRFTGQPGGSFNHGMGIRAGRVVLDPLADGRRAGIYHYHGEAYPAALIDLFAYRLRLSDGHNAGPDHFEASFTRVGPAPTTATYRVSVAKGRADNYRTRDRTIVGRVYDATVNGYSANCTRPATYLWPGHGSFRLVKLLSGTRAGHHLNVGNSRVTVREIAP